MTSYSFDGKQPLIDVREVSVGYKVGGGLLQPGQTMMVVDNVSLQVSRGETLGLVGESGSGKSTIARAVLGLTAAASGKVIFDGVDLSTLRGKDQRAMRRRIQMVFQNPYSTLDPRMSIGATIAEPMVIHGIGHPSERHAKVLHLLETVGLNPDFASRYPDALSGGQRQRVSIARALASEPELIVADEPISALDVSIQAQVVNLLHRLQREQGLAYLFITHDLSIVQNVSHRIAVMYFGQIMETGPARQVCSAPIHPYSAALISAIPKPNPRLEKARTRIVLDGEVPSRIDPPKGCSFHGRCWLRKTLPDTSICTQQRPELREVVPGQQAACHFADHVVRQAENSVSPLA